MTDDYAFSGLLNNCAVSLIIAAKICCKIESHDDLLNDQHEL